MSRKCPPGVICFENMTIIFLILIILFFVYLFYINNNTTNKIVIKEKNNLQVPPPPPPPPQSLYISPNLQQDVFLDPYAPPLRNDNIIRSFPWNTPIVPINIPTQPIGSTYRQVGILTRMTGKEQILPLMGKPLISNRDKWNFYTMTDKNNMIKLPVTHKGKSCTNEYGCDNIYNGDSVYVEGYNDAFRATIYDNDTMRYIPFL